MIDSLMRERERNQPQDHNCCCQGDRDRPVDPESGANHLLAWAGGEIEEGHGEDCLVHFTVSRAFASDSWSGWGFSSYCNKRAGQKSHGQNGHGFHC